MGSATVLCDPASVCDACSWLVADSSSCFRTTLAAVILDYMGLYCEAAWSPGWGHLYVSCFMWGRRNNADRVFQIVVTVSLSVTVAMYCLIQLYAVVSDQLKPHKPLLKLFSVKAVGKELSPHIHYRSIIDR